MSTATVADENRDAREQEARGLFDVAMEHHRNGRLDDALEASLESTEVAPWRPSLWNLYGVLLRYAKRHTDSLYALRHALELDPKDASAWSNLGNLFLSMSSPARAADSFRRAIAISPRNADFHHNLAVSLRWDDVDGAISAIDRALLFNPDHQKARLNRGILHLSRGDYVAGWSDYEARTASGDLPARAMPGRHWRGQDFYNQRLLIASEQGFGDAIWAARYQPMVRALGGEVVLEARPELTPLFEANGMADRIVPKGAGAGGEGAQWSTYQCSIPGLFTHADDEIPSAPYLSPSPERVERIRPLIAGDGFKVGIVWSGSITFAANHDRAAPLSRFIETFAQPGVKLFSLQKGPPEAELAAVKYAPVVDLAPHLSDFADTAAAISLLDLVVMTDSSVAHLAGALGCPVMVLLGRGSHWLWRGDGETTPWYPSMRLVRWRGSWPDVFDRAGAEVLRRALAGPPPKRPSSQAD